MFPAHLLSVLRYLCRNANGLFWAGDTAQTIAVGCSFRLDDLKAFLYRFEGRSQQPSPPGQKRREGVVGRGPSALRDARTFHLTINHRSHGGIVQCATTVVGLIVGWWEYAIDDLLPEKAVVNGVKPLWFSDQYHRTTLHVRSYLASRLIWACLTFWTETLSRWRFVGLIHEI